MSKEGDRLNNMPAYYSPYRGTYHKGPSYNSLASTDKEKSQKEDANDTMLSWSDILMN
ncbi:MAG: hypothetical protein M3044_20015 [Thermoproteota archaeon]|nr:hypothetical protein [Thermoproteota archaeon]